VTDIEESNEALETRGLSAQTCLYVRPLVCSLTHPSVCPGAILPVCISANLFAHKSVHPPGLPSVCVQVRPWISLWLRRVRFHYSSVGGQLKTC